MEKPSVKPSGWRSFRFDFTSERSQVVQPPQEIDAVRDRTCHKEQCGCGCYRSVVDVDRLDEQ